MPRHSEDGICFKDRQSRYRARQVFMHCCLAVWAAAKVKELRSASRALSIPVLNDRNTANCTETTTNDRMLNFMAQLPSGQKHGEFGVTSQFFVEVQPSSAYPGDAPFAPRISLAAACRRQPNPESGRLGDEALRAVALAEFSRHPLRWSSAVWSDRRAMDFSGSADSASDHSIGFTE